MHAYDETHQGSTATLDSVCYLVYLGQYLNSIQEEFLEETS
jgi:hypothetical protein